MKARKIIAAALALVVAAALFACTPKDDNIVFTAVIEDVYDNGILVVNADYEGFDRASVGFAADCKAGFVPEAGQRVRITALPEIRESYPVQITAVKIELLGSDSCKRTRSAGS